MSNRRQSQFDDQPSAFTWAQVGITGAAPGRTGPTDEFGLLLEAIWIARASRRFFDPKWTGTDLKPLDIQVVLVARLTAPHFPATADIADLLGVSRAQVDKALQRLCDAGLVAGERLGSRGRRLRIAKTGELLVDANLRHMRRSAEVRGGAWKHRLVRAPQSPIATTFRDTSRPLGIEDLRAALTQILRR